MEISFKKYKYYFASCFICAILIIILIAYKNKTNAFMKITIFPSGSTSETYCFAFKSNNIMEVSLGDRSLFEDISSDKFFEAVSEQSRVVISKEDEDILIGLTEKVIEIGKELEKMSVSDGWYISIYYKDTVYDFTYSGFPSTAAKELVNKLKSCSPIEVDIHGWT